MLTKIKIRICLVDVAQRFISLRLIAGFILNLCIYLLCFAETQSYVLNFHGRVTQASIKNFQIIHASDRKLSVVLF